MTTGDQESGLLVGVDGSAGSRHALEWAAARTPQFGPIQPLTTWLYPWWAVSGPTPMPEEHFKSQAEEEVQSALDSVGHCAHRSPIVCRGRAGPTLVDLGASAGLTVVGTRGRSGIKDLLLGSVSSYLVAHATAPVAVVPQQAPVETRHRRIVVGVDGSPNSVGALGWALRHAPIDSTIEVSHSWIYPASAMPDMAAVPFADYELGARRVLDETVHTAIEATEGHHAAIEKRLEYGDARTVLHDRQELCDLLVLGARGHGGVAHLLLGSVTSALIHQPTTAIVVVPGARET